MNRKVTFVFINICVVLVLIGLIVMQPASAAAVSHEGTATVKGIDLDKGIVKLSHGPITSLKWPAMTMDFKFKDSALMQGIMVGDAVTFTFIESNGDYVITHIRPSK
ncbi:copper-binding protein [Nitrosomonas sp. Nm166]|uniref:copper-binding protein n=1 Tax=Nitrosomonas sp. Nm166 TaxID=1881054 RepID=UPI0008EF0E7E|nr:copper-binding protein [Nitrosomonas sp. Nm166]SFD86520.1 membrane fusion protein, Cu(I)/Ag(I) efflux system/membrane fusion protein, cobalt-zinc-cadmium efflux system [Nitrosomonas sp. Nm166]